MALKNSWSSIFEIVQQANDNSDVRKSEVILRYDWRGRKLLHVWQTFLDESMNLNLQSIDDTKCLYRETIYKGLNKASTILIGFITKAMKK